jgi:hypothetical protein
MLAFIWLWPPVELPVLCNRYGFTIAVRSLGEFQGASEAPVSAAILAEGATRKFAQRTAARRVVLKMPGAGVASRSQVAKDMLPRHALAAGHFEFNDYKGIPVTQH